MKFKEDIILSFFLSFFLFFNNFVFHVVTKISVRYKKCEGERGE